MSKAWTAVLFVVCVVVAVGLVLPSAGARTGADDAGAESGPGREAPAGAGEVEPESEGAPDGGIDPAGQREWQRESRYFEVDVLVDGRPLAALYGGGRRYVEAREGAEYEVRIRNPLPVRVAVALSVDGLNSIDARRTSAWNASKWVLEPYQTIRISGWQMSSQHARRFYFTTERDSYAARLGRASDLGLITAVFYRERPPVRVAAPPAIRDVEPRARSSQSQRSESPAGSQAGQAEANRSADVTRVPSNNDDEYAATGIGRSVDNQVRWVSMEIERTPDAEVSIRYEYRDALFKLGLLPRPAPDADPLRRRERARGFEDPRFCPEP